VFLLLKQSHSVEKQIPQSSTALAERGVAGVPENGTRERQPATALGMTITLWALGMVGDEILVQQGGLSGWGGGNIAWACP